MKQLVKIIASSLLIGVFTLAAAVSSQGTADPRGEDITRGCAGHAGC